MLFYLDLPLDLPLDLDPPVNDPKNQARDMGSSVRRYQLGIRDCMAEEMGIVDENGEFVPERVSTRGCTGGFTTGCTGGFT